MASVFSRKGTSQLWLKFRHPVTDEVVRLSLGTTDPAWAEIVRQKVEAWVVLNSPLTAHIHLPASLGTACAVVSASIPSRPSVPPIGTSTLHPRRPIATVVSAYIEWCKEENSEQHVRTKKSYLRRLFGEEVVPGSKLTNRGKGPVKPYCTKSCLEDILVEEILAFIKSVSESTCTRRHVREIVHQLWEFALTNDHLVATNFHTPNVMSALPSYSDSDRIITFLNQEEVGVQLSAVRSSPSLHTGVGLMIHGGLRRNEAVWMRRKDVHLDRGFMSVLFKADERERGNSLKTGQRPVTIIPALRRILEPVLAVAGPEWLVPNAAGGRCNKDNFSEKLREANAIAGLTWTCNEFRHTFATTRLAEGMSIFHLSKEMGTSVPTLMKHYAAFVSPDQLFRGAS